MTNRFKLIAAALGFVVAAGAIGDASAATVTQTVATRTVAAKTVATKTVKVAARPHHRLHFGSRIVRHVRIAHRAPNRVTVVKTFGPRVVTKKFVRIYKAPLPQRHAMLHRTGAKTIVVR